LPPAARRARADAVRESITLPVLFITVAIGGGFSAAADTGQFRFVAPPLVHLVLALLALGVLVRAGALAPDRLVHAARRPLENLSGTWVVATLFAATAQVLSALTPQAGLLHFVFVVFFAVLFWNTLAMNPDARRALRSLALVLGSALVLKHVVLAALVEPRPSLAKRVLSVLLEGVTLGSLQLEPMAPLTGYVAFASVLLYFIGLLLLPRAPAEWRTGEPPRPPGAEGEPVALLVEDGDPTESALARPRDAAR
jgi:hypothetical protein